MTTKTIDFKDSAAFKVKSLIEEEGNPNLKFRAYIMGGGCSGLQYGFTFDEDIQEADHTFENQGVTLLVDENSYPYLLGSEIDYVEGPEGDHFLIRNPNAKTSCGCGNSFSVEENQAAADQGQGCASPCGRQRG